MVLKSITFCKNLNLYPCKHIALFIAWMIGCVIAWNGCNGLSSYPPTLKHAIDLFYIENENDSILGLLDADTNLNKTFPVMKRLLTAAALCEKGKVDSSSAIMVSINRESIDKTTAFWYYHINGLVLFRENQSAQAYEMLLKAVSEKCVDIRANALSERIIARILFTYGSNKEGVGWIVKSSRHFDEAGLEKSIGINDKILGRYYMNAGNLQDASRSFAKSEAILRKYNDTHELYYIYINWIDYYITVNELDRAEEYAKTCLKILEKYDDHQMGVLLYNNLGEILLKQQRLDEAERYFLLTAKTPPGYVGAHIRVTNALIFLSDISARRGDNVLALKYVEQARALFATSDYYMSSQCKLFNRLSELHTLLKNKEKAYYYSNLSEACRQTMHDEQVALTREIYDVKTDLLKSTHAVEELRAKTKSRLLVIIVVSIALFITGVAFIFAYSTWKSKAETLRSLAKKNLQLLEEERREMTKIRKTTILKRTSLRTSTENPKTKILYAQISRWLLQDENFKRNDLSIEILANNLNTNREYASQAINAHGITFIDLINKMRINEAMQILSDPNHTLYKQKMTTLSSSIGFNSDSVFFNAFKKQTGMTPSQFRAGIPASAGLTHKKLQKRTCFNNLRNWLLITCIYF